MWFDEKMIPATLPGLKAEVAFTEDIPDHHIRQQLDHFTQRGVTDTSWTNIMTGPRNPTTGRQPKARIRSYQITRQGKELARAQGIKVYGL